MYTLYENPGGYPFVHALDTVRGVAHCVGLPWHGSQNAFYNMRLSLRSGDRSLAVHWLSGRPWLRVDTSTWAVAPDRRTGPPWLGIGAAGAAVLLAGAALLLVRRRRRAAALEQCLAKLLDGFGTRGTTVGGVILPSTSFKEESCSDGSALFSPF